MRLGDLKVIHLDKTKFDPNLTPAPLLEPGEGAFFLDSCQRKLWLGIGHHSPCGVAVAAPFERFTGEVGYEFLLRVATGLESAVLGETDIFGQLKKSWITFEQTRPDMVGELLPWMQSLFEDAKEIRSRYLTNLGGASYGSLTRMLLKPDPKDSILLVGAGQLAQAVGPYLLDSRLLLWNRSLARCAALQAELTSKGARFIRTVADQNDEELAWREATHVIVCVPKGDSPEAQERDERWIALREHAAPQCKTLHLGSLRNHVGAGWERLSGYLALNDLFDLKDSQSNVRDIRMREARNCCRERARLRMLGRSLSIAHGWEDLAQFGFESRF